MAEQRSPKPLGVGSNPTIRAKDNTMNETDKVTQALNRVLIEEDFVFARYWLSYVADAYYHDWKGTEPLETSSEFRTALDHVIRLGHEYYTREEEWQKSAIRKEPRSFVGMAVGAPNVDLEKISPLTIASHSPKGERLRRIFKFFAGTVTK